MFVLDFPNDADLHKDVPFGGFIDIAVHLTGFVQTLESP